jgi:uncharacterized protein (TIGR00266 family)
VKIQVECKSAYSIGYVFLASGEKLEVESGSLMAMSQGITARVTTGGGIAKAAFRKVLGQENFFLTEYEATVDGAWVALTSKYPGDMVNLDLNTYGGVCIQSGSLVAVSDGVEVDVRYAGVRNIILREGATTLLARGVGNVLISSYGAIQEFPINQGESMFVDTGHIVAWTSNLQVEIGFLGGAVTATTSGEGLVAKYSSNSEPGKVWVQTRSEAQLRSWIFPERLQNKKSGE